MLHLDYICILCFKINFSIELTEMKLTKFIMKPIYGKIIFRQTII